MANSSSTNQAHNEDLESNHSELALDKLIQENQTQTTDQLSNSVGRVMKDSRFWDTPMKKGWDKLV